MASAAPVRRWGPAWVVAAALVTLFWLVAAAPPAGAHVDAEGSPATGSATSVTFSFTHGCDTAPTTSLRVQLPAGTSGVKAENPAEWTSTVSATELAWSGGSIPSGQPGSFTAVMTIPGQAGDTVFLPTVQGCPNGKEEAWIDKSEDPEATNAAPRIVLVTSAPPATTTAPATAPPATAAPTTTAAPRPATSGTAPTATAAPATSPASTDASSSNTPLVIGAIVVLLLLLGAGGYAVSRRSRT